MGGSVAARTLDRFFYFMINKLIMDRDYLNPFTHSPESERLIAFVNNQNEVEITREDGESFIIPITSWDELKQFIDNIYKHEDYE